MRRPDFRQKPYLPGAGAGALLALSAVAAVAGCKENAPDGGGRPGPSSSSSAAVREAAPKRVSLVSLPVRVGYRTRKTEKSSMKLAVEFWQDGKKIGANDSTRSEEYTRQTEVLGIVGGAPAKIRTSYEQYHLAETHPDKPKVDVSILTGRAYVLDAGEKGIAAADEHGKPVGKEEESLLVTLHTDLGKDDPLVTALGSAPITIGKSVTLREPLFRAFAGTANGEFKSGTATLSGTNSENGRAVAIFDWAAEMSSNEENGLEMTWHMKGQAVVGLSPAITLRARTEAALDVSGHTIQNGAMVDMAGDGSFKEERSTTPL